MGDPDADTKPDISEEEQAEPKTDKAENQREEENDDQSFSEVHNDSISNDKDATVENPSESEELVETMEANEGTKALGSEEVQGTGTPETKQNEPETQDTQMHDNDNAAEETLELTCEATKAIKKPQEKEEGTSLQTVRHEDTVIDQSPEASGTKEEVTGDGTEEEGSPLQDSDWEKDDDGNQEHEDQRGADRVDESSKDENEMDIDTEPVSTGSGPVALPRPNGIPTKADKEKEDEAGSAGDVSPQDDMELDSKPYKEDTASREAKKEDDEVKQSSEETAPKQTSTVDEETSPERNSEKAQGVEQKVLRRASAEGKTASEDEKLMEGGQKTSNTQDEDKQLQEKEKSDAKQPKDSTERRESTPTRPRRSSTRNTYQPRTLRPRTSGRTNTAVGAPESATAQDTAPQNTRPVSGSPKEKQNTNPGPIPDKESNVDPENVPRPVMEAKGLAMRIDEAIFVTEDQLDELKIARLTDKKVKPFEHLTFQDLRTYNRDQLRAYCFAYGMARRKKTEMEADMARYLSYWNRGREGFALHEYVPTSSRVIDRTDLTLTDSVGATRVVAAQASPASREGSTTPTTSNGKATPSVKPSSSRAATPSRSAGPAASSVRVSASQGSSALSSASPAGVPTSTGNSQAPGSTQAGTQRTAAATARAAKPANTAPVLPRGFGTSFKQRVHARQAGAKFKAAYNGAGPTIVNIVENAAAYFEGKDSPEVILDQAKSYERYQFNVDMLNEIFDGVPDDSDEVDGDVEMRTTEPIMDADKRDVSAANESSGSFKKNVLETIASRVASAKRNVQAAELKELEKHFKEMEERTKYTERTNMRLFQRLERAETKEQIESVQREFETVHNIKFDECNPPPLVRRKLDRTLPPLVMSDEKCRILRFKVT